ncbi:MAG: hypothetical protein HQM11_19815 [SAR324 cluster bacterium]|nr:hypothetical protein [SAR324 cluster bacterium]
METLSFYAKSPVILNTQNNEEPEKTGFIKKLMHRHRRIELSPAEIAINRLHADLARTRQQVLSANS